MIFDLDQVVEDAGAPFVNHKQWLAILEHHPGVEWTYIGTHIGFDPDFEHYLARTNWILENCKHPVYDSTIFDYYFYNRNEAMLFKLWLTDY